MFASSGEVPIGINMVRVNARCSEGEADRDVPRLRWHPITDRR
jgi:hypothetical protein